MASRKRRMPEKSRIDRVRSVAYARKQKPGAGDSNATTAEAQAEEPAALVTPTTSDADTRPVLRLDPETLEPARSDAELPPRSIVDDRPLRSRTSTVAMTPHSPVGLPPEIEVPPPAVATPSISIHGVEDPTHMPGPREIPAGSPEDPAAPPGAVPPGDSRSLRKRTPDHYEFALIYRQGTFVITRMGMVGTRGQWRVVEYPTQAAAAHAYAKECSRFVSEGFSDYRA